MVTICDVTAVGTILPVPIAIGREVFTTIGASEVINSLSVHAAGVVVPPSCTAGIGAELPWLAF